MRIAILGTGNVGRTLGAGFVSAGHEVVFGSRNQGQASELPAPALRHVEAIDDSDVVVSALAAAHPLDTLTPLREPLAGRVLVDIGTRSTSG